MDNFAYDQVFYPSYPFSQTHPDRLATIASLLGMQPTPIDHCRVLELGCGDGTNLYAMAEAYPQSQFVGIDLAEGAIAKGQNVVTEIGLDNLQLVQADLMAINESIGKFDYIISHGVYSWIPPQVRDQLMHLSRHLLTDNGIAYISYNAYPGFYLRQLPRDMMRLHARNIHDPKQKVEQGLALLQLILQRFDSPAAAKEDLYGHLILENLTEMQAYRHQEGIYHDILADENTPVYFYQFASHAAHHGLQYLSEADFCETQLLVFPQAVRDVLVQFSDEQIIQKEQYMDYLKCRIFRQTLLCRNELKLDRSAKPELLARFFLSARIMQYSAPLNLLPDVIEEFKLTEKIRISTDFPLAKAALHVLSSNAPRLFSWDELAALSYHCLSISDQAQYKSEDVATLQNILYAAYSADVINLHIAKMPIAEYVAERPQTTKLVRYQAAHGNAVTSLLHATVDIESPLSVQLLALLDGTRMQAEIIEHLLALPEAAALKNADGADFSSEEELHKHLAKCLPEILEELRKKALLLS